jgi:CHASE3 domain sensor protein
MMVVAVPLIALMGITSANLLLQHEESQERNVSKAARNLAGAASQVLADAVNAETGVRGYAATRDPLFLAPYRLTLTRIGAERRSCGKRPSSKVMAVSSGRWTLPRARCCSS